MKVHNLLILGLFLSFFGNSESFANSCTQLFSDNTQYKFKEFQAKDLKAVEYSNTKTSVKVISRIQD